MQCEANRAKYMPMGQEGVEKMENKRGGSGAKLDGAVPSRDWAPKRDISRLGTLGRRRNARSLRRSRGGSWPERSQTGHGWKASPPARRRCHSRIILHRGLASSAYGRSEIFPPMNRWYPAPRRMARCYGSRCGTRGQRLLPEPPLLFAFGTHDALERFSDAMLLAQKGGDVLGTPLWACRDEGST
jgi:hypothetical protein